MTSSVRPQQDVGYNFKTRPEFMPKGLSPVLLFDHKIDGNLSPMAKTKLHDEILKSYESELDHIKWEKYLKGYDPGKFFDEMYKKKAGNFNNEIPSINESNFPLGVMKDLSEFKFPKTFFDDLEIIGQVDRKFIVAVYKKNFSLVLFDQHAVHERTRLEDLMKEYEGVNVSCENVTIFMIQNDVKLLKNHQGYLNTIGVHFRALKNGITVHRIPLSLYNKTKKETKENSWNLPKLLELLIQEILEQIKDTRGILTGLPQTLHQIISSEACRGSIKFGDNLSEEEMRKLVENLSKCSLPFQCAHGRPTLTPILSLDREYNVKSTKPHLKKLLES
ncbi:hypothetical protein HHI36_001715 [Cryptolaemus montrouzieri]|uniref:MutL C-terminal dimerisation domain-containing protein n=1 Tax=Cryptolaemus montrouzieri TaxID=559131 RepID=A0ABD2P898_9CUCU